MRLVQAGVQRDGTLEQRTGTGGLPYPHLRHASQHVAAAVVGIGHDRAMREVAELGDLGGACAAGPQRPAEVEPGLDDGFRGVRLQLERLVEQPARHFGIGAREAVQVPAATPDQVVEFRPILPVTARPHLLGVVDLGVENADQLGHDRIERVLRPVRRQRHAVRPHRVAGDRVGQVDGGGEAVGGPLDAALEHVLCAELLPDDPGVELVGGEGETRAAGNHRQPAQPGRRSIRSSLRPSQR